MTFLSRALSAFQRCFSIQRETEDTYLAGSVDIYDLERRMKQLEKRDSQQPLHLRHSV